MPRIRLTLDRKVVRNRMEKMVIKIKTALGRIWKDIKNFRAAACFIAVYNVAARMLFDAFCPQLILTGLPCAGCGMTRAVFYILTGRLARGCG